MTGMGMEAPLSSCYYAKFCELVREIENNCAKILNFGKSCSTRSGFGASPPLQILCF